MSSQRPHPGNDGRRMVVCDYNAMLNSVTGVLRMSGYSVFQAYHGWAALELCLALPDIELLVVNTYGTGINVGKLCRGVRGDRPGLPILHIGTSIPDGLPDDVPTLAEGFTSPQLLLLVADLMGPAVGAGAA
jgi:response regulator RpfG family c-di-GMP phosphodiesterase